MPHLNLDDEERETLREALESYLSDLHTEISHTDNRDYRSNLKRRREVLKKVVEALTP